MIQTYTQLSTGVSELFQASCPGAFHDSQARYPPPRCLLGTRVDILRNILEWIERSNKKILWLTGPAGTGKSAIAQTIAEICANNAVLAASFFFFYGAPDRSAAERLIPSIAYQLAIRMPEKRTQLEKIVKADPSVLYKPLELQIQTLITPLFIPTPLNKTHTSISSLRSRLLSVVIIDGLDECKGDNNQRDIIQHIAKIANTHGVPLRFMIISRHEPQIEESFGHLIGTFHVISLAERDHVSQARDDIRTYLQHGFNQIYQKRRHDIYTEHFWPTEDIIRRLVNRAGGVFIYASTVIKYVDDDDFHPKERLGEILDTPSGLSPFTELDRLYCRILGASPNTEHLLQMFTIVSLCIKFLTSQCELCTRDIELLLKLPQGNVGMILRRMRSILGNTHISPTTHISFCHKTFMDFLHNKERAGKYFIDVKDGHAFIAQKLLDYLRFGATTSHSGFLPETSASSPTPAVMASGICSTLVTYAQFNWHHYLKISGSWDEHPHLLEEISEALDSSKYPLFPPTTESYIGLGLKNLLQWFEVSVYLLVGYFSLLLTEEAHGFRYPDAGSPADFVQISPP